MKVLLNVIEVLGAILAGAALGLLVLCALKYLSWL